jgi:hypothetical protein
MKKKYVKKNYSAEIVTNIPLPDVKFEKPRYVAMIRYQIPKRLLLNGRRKTSPKFETMYGMLYWLNKQPYNMDYVVYRTDKEAIIKRGRKKIGETIK